MITHSFDNGMFRGARLGSWNLIRFCEQNKIKTIISLEEGWASWFRGDECTREDICESLDLRYFSMRMSVFFPPSLGELYMVTELLKKATPESALYMHCYSGVDRTGVAVVAHRVRNCGWSQEAAWQECFKNGFHRYFYFWWPRYLRKTLAKLQWLDRD